MRHITRKLVPLSLNVPEHVKSDLTVRAEREGHRYPGVYAAHLLERALAGGPPTPGGRIPMSPEVREAFDALEGAFGDLLGRILSDERACDMLGEIREHVAVVRGVFS